MPAFFQVAKDVLVGICFAFERYVEISARVTFVLYNANEPFDAIEKVVGDITPFFHLCCVNAFVVECDLIARTFCEKNAEEIYGVEVFSERDDFVVDDFHKLAF